VTPQAKAIVKRWTIGIAIIAVIYFFGWSIYLRGSQLSWHLLNRNQLKLQQARYVVPWRWLVRHEATGMFLQDYPLTNRNFAVIEISEGRPNLRHPAVDQYLTADESFAKEKGSLLAIRRLTSAGRQVGCVESNVKIGSLITIFNVLCHSSVEDFYAILSSAQPN